MLSRFQELLTRALRPAARMARKILTPPPPPPPPFLWHKINRGAAAGAEINLPSGTAIAHAIVSGSYEQRTMEVVAALVSDADVCFDIGGHYGAYTLTLASLTKNGAVHTFEPVPAHADRIREGARRSKFSHVTVHQVAMADKVGEMMLRFANGVGDDSMGYLETYGGVNTEAAIEHYAAFSSVLVTTTTLDDFGTAVSNDAVSNDAVSDDSVLPNFIKIDAEGAEVAILLGGLNLIAQAKPRLLVELHGIQEALGCADVLRKLDYQAILLTNQKETMPVLWVPRHDSDAVLQVQKILGAEPTVLFGAN